MMKNFISAGEVANELGVSKPYAYKLVKEMNDELKKNGYITIAGRVSRKYFEEKFYGIKKAWKERTCQYTRIKIMIHGMQ